MDTGLVVAVGLGVAFALSNGVLGAANSIATLVATRAATPAQAVVMAAVFSMLGPLLIGAAIARTMTGVVSVPAAATNQTIGAGLVGALGWNCVAWIRRVPSSSGQAIVGGLLGGALAQGGFAAVRWGGLQHGHLEGVFGTVIGLVLSPALGTLGALLVIRALRRLAHRMTRRWSTPTRCAHWTMAAALAFSNGANDAQKSVGVITVLLLADGRISSLAAPAWVTLACGAALAAGTGLGGWRIIRTVGRGIYHIQPLEGLACTASSAAVIFAASVTGAPTSTSQVMASSVVGVGVGRRRWHHVHWRVVRRMAEAWLITLPTAALLGAVVYEIWGVLR